MTRVQIVLEDSQNEQLRHLAQRLHTTKSRLIREAVSQLLTEKCEEHGDPILNLIGQAGTVGRSDISAKHDEYLSQQELSQCSEKGSS